MDLIPGDPEGIEQRAVGPFKVTMNPTTGLLALEITDDQGETRVAVLTQEEAEKVAQIFLHIRDHAARGEGARIDLRRAFIDLIGRDPFEGQAP